MWRVPLGAGVVEDYCGGWGEGGEFVVAGGFGERYVGGVEGGGGEGWALR